MRWFSRRHRQTTTAKVAITTVPAVDSLSAAQNLEQWARVFALLDTRDVPATWALRPAETRLLAAQMVASQVQHELGFAAPAEGFTHSLPSFRQQLQLAQKVELPLRTLATTTAGIHPSLLSRLGVQAVVPLDRRSSSRTGQLRALAWNTWECPATHVAPLPCSAETMAQLTQSLEHCVRRATRMHLVLELRFPIIRNELEALEKWLDTASDYAQRGWLKLETVGQQAAELSGSLGRDFEPQRRVA